MTAFVPPRPRALEARAKFPENVRQFLKSGLALFLRGSFGFVGVSRHALPRLPFAKRSYSYSVRDPEAIHEVLVTRPTEFPKSRLMDLMLRQLTGYSIFISNGESWRRQRAIIDQAFENARVREVFGLMREASEELCRRLTSRLRDQKAAIVDIDVEMMHFAGDVIFRAIFSEPMTEAVAREIFTAFERFQRSSYKLSYISMLGVPIFLLPGWRRVKRDAAIIRNALNRPIARRLAKMAQGLPTPEKDILATLISSKDPVTDTSFDPTELLDQIAMLFLAGHETSAAALGWTLYLIANQTGVQDRMADEARAVLGERPIEFSDLRRLGIIRNAFQETLRLYPPVAFFARDAAGQTELCGQAIEGGALTIIPAWLMHRNDTLWKDSDLFDPDRFSDPMTKSVRACAYFPFSMGPRVCPGAAFALQEATMVLAILLRSFRFLPVPDHTPEPVSRLTLRSDNGLPLRIQPR
jgi:cytochrome P450